MNAVYLGMPLNKAMEANRLHHQLFPHFIKYEPAVNPVRASNYSHKTKNPKLSNNLEVVIFYFLKALGPWYKTISHVIFIHKCITLFKIIYNTHLCGTYQYINTYLLS